MLTFHRNRSRTGARALERCPACRRPFMCPLDWHTAGKEHWVIDMRCGECGHRCELLVTNAEAKRYDLTLDRQAREIAIAAWYLDRERMRCDLDVLVAALDRDLIDAADFAT